MDEKKLHAHFRKVLAERWRTFRRRLRQCTQKFSEPSVHDLRVSIRRFISLVDFLNVLLLLGPRVLKTRLKLKKIFKKFTTLRDVQVQALYLEQHFSKTPAVQPFIEMLHQQEKQGIQKIKRGVKSIRMESLKRGKAAVVKHLPFLAELEENALKKTIKATYQTVFDKAKALNVSDVTTFHALRIAFKKYRYQVELLVPLFPNITPKRLEAMRELQLSLGAIQDFSVLLRNFHQFMSSEPDKTLSRALLRIEKKLLQQQRNEMKTLMVSVHPALEACNPKLL